MSQGEKKCVFFDRDGVVNVSPGAGYVTRWEDFKLSPGIVEALAVVKECGFLAILITSQRCVGKGLITEAQLEDLHQRLQDRLQAEGVGFDDIFAFTGLPGTETWEKPNPEMILLAGKKHGIDLSRSLMIGDADRDIVMGQQAGLPTTVRVRGEKPIGVTADHTVDAVADLAPLLKTLI